MKVRLNLSNFNNDFQNTSEINSTNSISDSLIPIGKSGIHIKKKNRGKFTSYCGGKVTDACIRRAKASGNPTLVKRATFAANARKWKHLKGGQIRKMQPGSSIHYSRNMTTDNLSKAANYVGEYVLKGLGAFGKFLNAGFTSPTYGTTGQVSYARNAEDAKRQRELSEASEQAMGKAMTWVSPLNYGAAVWNGHGLDARKGEEEVASWSPAQQAFGRLVEMGVGPKAVKGVKYAPKVIVNTAAKAGVKPAKAAVIARETNNVVNKGFIKLPRKRGSKWLRESNLLYIIDNEATAPQILESWWLDRELNSGNKNKLVHFDRGDFKPNYWLEDYEGNNVKGAYIKNNELVNPNNNELYWFPGKPFAELHWQHKPYSRFNVPSRYITVDRSNGNFVDKPFFSGGEEFYETVSKGPVNLDNAKILLKSPFGWWERVKVLPGIEGKQLKLVSNGTYPLYRGPRFNVSEIVNSDGTINPRKAMLVLHTVVKQFGKDAYKMEHRRENPEWHKEDPNTYEHTKRVTLSAWKLPTPEGYTKQDQMIAALGHDFGKIISGDGHEQIGADLAKQVFIDIKPYLLQAIREHMGLPTTKLGEATQAADMLNGRDFSYLLQTSPELYNKIFGENAESMTPEQWTTAQDAAIARGDMAEAQRLSDLHSDIAAKKEGFTAYNTYRSQKPNDKYKWENKSPYDDSRYGIGKSSGYFTTDSEPVARTYKYTDNSPLFNLNIYMKNPYIKDVEGRSWQFADTRVAPNGAKYGVTTDEIVNKVKPEGVYDGVIFKNIVDVGAFRRNLNGASDVATDYVSFPGRAKLRDAVTYDDNGVRIPLGKRHNFSRSDIRYGLLPFIGLGTAEALYKKQHLK